MVATWSDSLSTTRRYPCAPGAFQLVASFDDDGRLGLIVLGKDSAA